MKKTEIEIPDGKRAEWVNGVLTLVDEKPIEYKFKVGDKVKTINDSALTYTITGQFTENGEPMYKLSDGFGEISCSEKWLTLIPQSITERIKTFEDAVEWCKKNGSKTHRNIVAELENICYHLDEDVSADLLAYLQLRIITAALNEGWEPKFEEDEERYSVTYNFANEMVGFDCEDAWMASSNRMVFKSKDLALYAAKQFRHIYADFCGGRKGGQL